MTGTDQVEVRRSNRRRRTVSAYRDGDRIVVLIPASMSKRDEARWVQDMVLAARALRGAQAALGRAADGAGRAAQRRVLRRAGPARVGALGRQPAGALGVVHARGPVDPALHPAAGHAVLGGRLRPGPRARAPARAGPRRQLLGLGEPLPARRARPRLPAGLVGGRRGRRRRAARATSTEPSAGARSTGTVAAATSSCISCSRPSGSASTGHQRTARDSSLAACAAPAGARAVNRTSRWWTSPRGSQKSTACSSRCTGTGSSSRSGRPDSSSPSRRAAPARVRSSGSQCPPKANQRPALRCRLSSTRSRSGERTSTPAVRWSG